VKREEKGEGPKGKGNGTTGEGRRKNLPQLKFLSTPSKKEAVLVTVQTVVELAYIFETHHSFKYVSSSSFLLIIF